MTRSLSRWLAAILLAAGILSPAVCPGQVVMSLSDEDPSYPIATAAEEDEEEGVSDDPVGPMGVVPELDRPTRSLVGGEHLGDHQAFPADREPVAHCREHERSQGREQDMLDDPFPGHLE